MEDGLADIGSMFFVQYLVARCDDADLHLLFQPFPEFLAAHGEYDAIVPTIEQSHGQVQLPDQRLAGGEPGAVLAQGDPALVEDLACGAVADIVVHEFEHAAVDQAEPVHALEQEKKPAGVLHGEAEQSAAQPGLGAEPVPAIHLQSIRRQQDELAHPQRVSLKIVQGQPAAEAKADQGDAQLKAIHQAFFFDHCFDDRFQIGSRSFQTFAPEGLPMPGQVDREKGVIQQIRVFGQKSEMCAAFAIAMQADSQPATLSPAMISQGGLAKGKG